MSHHPLVLWSFIHLTYISISQKDEATEVHAENRLIILSKTNKQKSHAKWPNNKQELKEKVILG